MTVYRYYTANPFTLTSEASLTLHRFFDCVILRSPYRTILVYKPRNHNAALPVRNAPLRAIAPPGSFRKQTPIYATVSPGLTSRDAGPSGDAERHIFRRDTLCPTTGTVITATGAPPPGLLSFFFRPCEIVRIDRPAAMGQKSVRGGSGGSKKSNPGRDDRGG